MSGFSREDASVELKIDGSFTGILRGRTDDVSEGCKLEGDCILHVHKNLRVNKLSVIFDGQCKVSIKTAASVGKPRLEGAECHTLIRRAVSMNQDRNKPPVEFQPGDYTYPFRFDLPSTLPASFRGKRGYIRYRLEAVVQRASNFVVVVNKHIRARIDICLRRCLLSDTILNTPLTDMIHGEDHTDRITYSVTAPTIVHCEGGLVPLNLTLHLAHPDTQSVLSVTCALRERIVYQTTGLQSMPCQSISKTDDLFPLGWSTFYPSKSGDYDPYQKHEYNAEFRLCPRVNPDSSSIRLIKVSHALVVYIVAKDTITTTTTTTTTTATATAAAAAAATTTDSKTSSSVGMPATTTVDLSVHEDDNHSTFTHPPTPPPQRSSSTSSLEGLVKEAANVISSTIRRKNSDSGSYHPHHHPPESPPLTLSPTAITSTGCREQLKQKKMFVCSLEFPIVVTSRERYWESNYPTPPAYRSADDPPTYGQTLVQLPPAPAYN